MLRVLVALAVPLVAVTTILYVLSAVGVPDIAPDELIESPGTLPEHVHAAPEGFETSEAVYDVPTTPEGRLDVVIEIEPEGVGVGVGSGSLSDAFIESVKVFSAVIPFPVATIVKVFPVTASLGIPVILEPDNESPVGRVLPAFSAHDTLFAPVASRYCE